MRPAARYLLFGNRLPGLQLGFATDIYGVDGARYSSFLSLPGATYTRAGAATAETAAGAIINFAADVPRITDRGVLIEEARTNLLIQGQCDQFFNAAGTTPPTKTDSVTYLGVSSTRAVFTSAQTSTGYGGCRLSRDSAPAQATIVSGSTYAQSLSISLSRVLVGGESITYYWTGVTGSSTLVINAANSAQYVGAFRRETIVTTAVSSGAQFPVVFLSGVMATDLSVYVAYGQCELGAFATSYIPTTGAAATRAADDMVLTGLNVRDGCTMYTEMLAPAGITTDARIGLCDTSTSNQLRQVWTPSVLSPTAVLSGAGTVVGGAAVAASAQIKAAFRHSAGVYSSSTNGGAVQTTVTTPLPTMTQYFVGRSASANVRHWNNYIRNVTIYQVALTDAQLQALTA